MCHYSRACEPMGEMREMREMREMKEYECGLDVYVVMNAMSLQKVVTRDEGGKMVGAKHGKTLVSVVLSAQQHQLQHFWSNQMHGRMYVASVEDVQREKGTMRGGESVKAKATLPKKPEPWHAFDRRLDLSILQSHDVKELHRASHHDFSHLK